MTTQRLRRKIHSTRLLMVKHPNKSAETFVSYFVTELFKILLERSSCHVQSRVRHSQFYGYPLRESYLPKELNCNLNTKMYRLIRL